MDSRLEEHYRRHMQEWVEFKWIRKSEQINLVLSKCESPIEQYMLLSMAFWDLNDAPDGQTVPVAWMESMTLEKMQVKAHPYDTEDIMIIPQFPIGSYRVDFLLVAESIYSQSRKVVVVECDGHDFHERTKRQAQKDKSRDRELQMLGLQVFRFTGSEIFKDADQCAAGVMAHLQNWQLEMQRASQGD